MQHAGRTRVPCVPFSHGLDPERSLDVVALEQTIANEWKGLPRPELAA